MWLWWYSLCVNLFLWMKYININKFVSLLPLILLVGYAIHDAKKRYDEKQDNDFNIFLICITCIFIVLVFFTDQIFLYFSIFLCVLVFFYMIKKGKDYFLHPPKLIRIGNAITFITTVFTYISLYGSIEGELPNYVPIIPFGICVITEFYVTWKVYYGKIEGLNEDFCILMVYNRMLFTLTTFSIFIIAICYVYEVVDSYYIFSFSVIMYSIGLILSNLEEIKKIKCKPKYVDLDNSNINDDIK